MALTSEKQEIVKGISLEWLDDEAIVVFTIQTVSRTELDKYYDFLDKLMAEWSPDKPFLAIYDASAITLTPYIRQMSQKVADHHRHLRWRMAVVAQKGVTYQLMRMFLRYFSISKEQQSQLFFTRPEALVWLREWAKD